MTVLGESGALRMMTSQFLGMLEVSALSTLFPTSCRLEYGIIIGCYKLLCQIVNFMLTQVGLLAYVSICLSLFGHAFQRGA